MRKDLRGLYDRLDTMSRDQMAEAFRSVLEAYSETLARTDTLESVQTEMSVQYQKMKEELSSAQKENEFLKQENLRLTEQLSLRKRDLFGSSSEKSDAVLEKALSGEEDEDPLQDEELPEKIPAGQGILARLQEKKSPRGKKRPGKREEDLSSLPHRTEFLLDIDGLNEQYGEGNWSIVHWTEYRTIESVRPMKYLKSVLVPVVSAGLEYEMVRVPYEGKLLKRSLVSSSLLAEIMYGKAVLALPFYRIEADLLREGVHISRVSMARWCIRFALDLFGPVYDYMCFLLLARGFGQSDETTLQVINDGRGASSVSYMWIHTTSELDEGNRIIVFSYELTRNTQHLRDFYLAHGFSGFLTSDAYVSYGLLEKESDGSIKSCGCFMHARRRFVVALLVMNLRNMSADRIKALPEFEAQRLIDEIYQADEPLKTVGSEERRERREQEVRPAVDKFFSYLHELDENWDPSYSSRFRDAVSYSLNNEKQLRMFLSNPSIPLDNGFAERCIRPYAVGRRNWLFSYSIEGAEALAILYTLAETAEACGAHPYYYYKYLLEEMPKHMDQKSTDRSYLEEMMPWSETYKNYEERQKAETVRFYADSEPVFPPKSPKQNRRPLPGILEPPEAS